MSDTTLPDLAELRKTAEHAANCDDTGGIWCFVGWAEKSNSAGVLAAIPYDCDDPLTGHIENDPDKVYSTVIAACDDDMVGMTRANFIQSADPTTVLALIDEIERLRDVVGWVDSWVSNPAGSYSTAALDGLFAMTRDRIATAQEQAND